MMSKFLLFAGIFISVLLFSQSGKVGVNTNSPTETLDVNGTLRVRDINQLAGDLASAKDSIVVFNSDGVLKYVSSSMIVQTADPSLFSNNEKFTTGTSNPTVSGTEKTGDTYQNTTDNSWWYYSGTQWLELSTNKNLTQILSIGNSAGNQTISNLTNPVNAQDAATKNYVDGFDIDDLLISGNLVATITAPNGTVFAVKETITNLSASGSSLTYYKEDGTTAVIDLKNLETTTSLSFSGTTLTYVDEDGAAQNINLANAFVTNTDFTNLQNTVNSHITADLDLDPTNENQTISAGTGINVNQTGQNFEIVNAAPDQTVLLSGGGATTISGTYPNFTITSTDNVDDADANSTNEIQTLSISGNSVSLSNGGGSVTIPSATGSETIVNGAGINTVTGTGTSADPYVITATEVDGSVTNEINTAFSSSNNTLTITDSNGSLTAPIVNSVTTSFSQTAGTITTVVNGVSATTGTIRVAPVKQVTADYTLLAADTGYVIYVNSSIGVTINITLPSGLVDGFNVSVYQQGTDTVNFINGSGATVVNRLSRYKTAGRYAGVGIVKYTGNQFTLTGDLKK